MFRFPQHLLHHRSIRFRRFARKRYAAFASLHREVSIGRLSVAVCDQALLKSGRSVEMESIDALSGSDVSVGADADEPVRQMAQTMLLTEHALTANQTILHAALADATASVLTLCTFHQVLFAAGGEHLVLYS